MNPANSQTALTLDELCDATSENRRTVRFYILNGLLTPPVGAGPAARYPGEHIERLRFIRQMQAEGMQLSKIRALLEATPLAELTRVTATPPPLAAAAPEPPGAPRPEEGLARSQWERVVLEPGVELHLRRPLGVATNRRVQRLLDFAQKLNSDANYKAGR